MNLGALSFGCGGGFTWAAFFFLEAVGAFEAAEALADAEAAVLARLAEGLAQEAVPDRLRPLEGVSVWPTVLRVSGV